jgi:hypothetical protein
MTDVNAVLYRDALLELARAGRGFAHAVAVAAERARRVQLDDPLAPVVASECRAALLHVLAVAPGMFPLFTKEDTHGLASDPVNDISAEQPAANQGS